jgi:RimJ/RimL family protein N-acetyltransferase
LFEAPILTTPRLKLRMLEACDFEEYAQIHSDFEVTRFTTRKPMTRGDSWQYMAALIGHWHLRGYGMWGVEELATHRLVGRVGFLLPRGVAIVLEGTAEIGRMADLHRLERFELADPEAEAT